MSPSYKLLSDNKLVELIKSGDSKANDHLFKRYEAFIIQQAQRFVIPNYEPDDIVQSANLIWLTYIKDFDEQRHCRITTYMSHVLHNKLISLYRKQIRKCDGIDFTIVSLNSFEGCDDEDWNIEDEEHRPVVDMVVGQIEAEELMKEIKFVRRGNTEYNRNIAIIEEIIGGSLDHEIAEKIGVTPKVVDNIRFKTRNQLRQIIEKRNEKNV